MTGLSEAGLSVAGLSEAGLSEAGLSEAGLSEAGLSEAGPAALSESEVTRRPGLCRRKVAPGGAQWVGPAGW